ncbi:hypothetical protein [Methylobacterium oxalidis]|uniref:Uncharacterized protein n=1 Tax=Methylobacterium oxalidis TaxID=944322 RepID=A0A512JDS9_9HYPH|nr:hypothetical protein [Methylobacterium oxalidis]GEP08100.1 hypothetical protein MOX02_61380 [Methylobacterium oxalidis]GJE33713.1 hypothetical protein LDDCCGHA_3916 [Methylobacterium oxalidis]GLS62265.1 hypothetical protein GCM10007888_06460 [Methylobacterium oxalidis]
MADDPKYAAALDHRAALAEDAADALLEAIAESNAASSIFHAVSDGGNLTTWREPGRTQLGPVFSCLVVNSIDADHWAELHRFGEDIYEAGGLDALDEAIMHIVQLAPAHADWRAKVLESVWFDVGRAA